MTYKLACYILQVPIDSLYGTVYASDVNGNLSDHASMRWAWWKALDAMHENCNHCVILLYFLRSYINILYIKVYYMFNSGVLLCDESVNYETIDKGRYD